MKRSNLEIKNHFNKIGLNLTQTEENIISCSTIVFKMKSSVIELDFDSSIKNLFFNHLQKET